MLSVEDSSQYDYYEITFHLGSPSNSDTTLYVLGYMAGALGALSSTIHEDESELIWPVANALVPVVEAGQEASATVTSVAFHSASDRIVEAPE